jgi:hypothetical protein
MEGELKSEIEPFSLGFYTHGQSNPNPPPHARHSTAIIDHIS